MKGLLAPLVEENRVVAKLALRHFEAPQPMLEAEHWGLVLLVDGQTDQVDSGVADLRRVQSEADSRRGKSYVRKAKCLARSWL